MLFVICGQALASEGISSCDMDMSNMTSQMTDNQNNMDCCDNATCNMKCSLSIVFILDNLVSFEALEKNPQNIIMSHNEIKPQSITSLFRPPIIR